MFSSSVFVLTFSFFGTTCATTKPSAQRVRRWESFQRVAEEGLKKGHVATISMISVPKTKTRTTNSNSTTTTTTTTLTAATNTWFLAVQPLARPSRSTIKFYDHVLRSRSTKHHDRPPPTVPPVSSRALSYNITFCWCANIASAVFPPWRLWDGRLGLCLY